MLKRRQIGQTEMCHGKKITAHHVGPDLICHVDGKEIGGFYLTAEAARAAGRRYVENLKKEKRT